MAIFAVPILLMIEASSLDEAQKSVDEWGNDMDLSDDFPEGTEDVDFEPNVEFNDEGARVLYMPTTEVSDELSDETNDTDDDFNGGEADF